MKLFSPALLVLAACTPHLAAQITGTHFLDDLSRVRSFRNTTASNAEIRQSMLYSW